MRLTQRFVGFNRHPRLEGSHAFLSPSSPHWLNYDEEKLFERLSSAEAAARGTSLHALAAHAISEGVMFADNGSTISLYVNHAIELGMTPEQTLFYSINCYGTADTIGFEELEMFLRIHDFKSGKSPTTIKQLYTYGALFCLEYGFKPFEIKGEFRIYQEDKIKGELIDNDLLAHIMDRIVTCDRLIEEYRGNA